MKPNTLFLRLEGPLQAWGDRTSKFVIRRTAEAPTRSGVLGMLCAALGVPRRSASEEWLPKLNGLRMGVRIDVPGIRWWDYHTTGAGMQMRTADGKTKEGALLSRREYLCDSSFLVALYGEPVLVGELTAAMKNPTWTVYLGRKPCPPTRPLLEHPPGEYSDILSALAAVPWTRRYKEDPAPKTVTCIYDWVPTVSGTEAPDDATVWYDVPVSFEPPSHRPRFVIRGELRVGADGDVTVAENPAQNNTPRPLRPRANYDNSQYRHARAARLDADGNLCVFCKSPATTVQHITYRRAGGSEFQDDLRSLCRLCHDAVTMLEYGAGMGLDRINPEDPHWRDRIINKRREIISFRSLERRRRRLAPEEVE
jgi:CRISPR system Cascade subunit CasD